MIISTTHHTARRAARMAIAAALAVAIGASVAAQPLSDIEANEVGVQMQGVGIIENRGVAVPLDLAFRDEAGRAVTLAEYFDGETPVVLNLVYYTCPSMCTVSLAELVNTLKQMSWTPGEQFRIVTVSINPNENPALALAKKQNMLTALARPEAAPGWAMLTGDEADIRALAATVGFEYRFVEETQQYAHDASLIILTPDGIVSQYLRGVSHEPRTVRLSLVEASQGRVGSPIDRFMVTVCGYDASLGKYVVQARAILAMGGIGTILAVLTVIAIFMIRGRRARNAATAASDRPNHAFATERPAHA